jgi:pimeloyl-ACP methyl ester carboxylesterase
MSFLNIEGTKIYYEDSLAGEEVLVFIHGFISSSICWRPLINDLSQRFRIIVFDLPGFGKTVASNCFKYTLTNYGITLNAFLEKLGIYKAHLVGHSLGSQIALQAVHSKPDFYQKLFLIAASAERKRPPWLARLFCSFPYLDEAAYRFYFQDDLVNIAISKVLAGGVGLEEDVLKPYINMCKRREVVKAVLKLGREREDDMSIRELNNISHQTYLLWGREDQIVRLTEGEFLHTHLKNSTLAVIEHCGHLPMEEYPTTVLHHLYAFFEPNFSNVPK